MLDISQRRYQVLGTAWLAWFVNYIDRTKTAALLPLIIASLAMTTQQTGWVLFAFFIGYAAVQPLAGFVTDLVGPKKALALSVGAFAIYQTAYTIGPIWAPFIAVPIATATGSWRWSFMVIAFFGLPVLAAIDHFVNDRPERDPRIRQAELDYIFGQESHRRG